MKKHLYLFSILTIPALQSSAQVLNGAPVTSSLIMSINGKPWEEIKYNEVEGFPYLTEDWNVGIVKFVNKG